MFMLFVVSFFILAAFFAGVYTGKKYWENITIAKIFEEIEKQESENIANVKLKPEYEKEGNVLFLGKKEPQ